MVPLVGPQFALADVKVDAIRYRHVLVGLDEKSVKFSSDVLEDFSYKRLKEQLIKRRLVDQTGKFNLLLTELTLDDLASSQLLRKMNRLGGDKVGIELLQSLADLPRVLAIATRNAPPYTTPHNLRPLEPAQLIIINAAATDIRSRPALIRNSRHPGFAPRSTNLISLKAVSRPDLRHRSISCRVCLVFLFYHRYCLYTLSGWDHPHPYGLSDSPNASYGAGFYPQPDGHGIAHGFHRYVGYAIVYPHVGGQKFFQGGP